MKINTVVIAQMQISVEIPMFMPAMLLKMLIYCQKTNQGFCLSMTYFKLFKILAKEFWPRLYAILCLNPKIKMFLLTQMLLEVQHLFWHQFLVTALAKQHLKMMGRSTKVVYCKLKIFLIFKGCTQLLEDSIAAVMPSPKHSILNQFRSRDTSCSGTSSSNARIQHNKFQIPCTF